MRARVLVRPKAGILDPQGVAVERALPALGFEGVANVHIGRLIELDVEDPSQREEMSRAWEEMQTEMVALSPYGKRIIARKSSHYVQRDEPEVVVAAIEEVLTGLRRAAASPGAPPTP